MKGRNDMARYNDTQNTIKAIKKRFNIYHEIPCSQDDRRVQEIIGIVIRTIEAQPAADIVPKSEVERLEHILDCYALQYGTVTEQQEVIDKAKAEVASILAELMKEIRAIADNYEKWANAMTDDDYARISYRGAQKGAMLALLKIAELKKKYTGEKVDGTN